MATIKEIASAAGVSKGAVSRILNNDSTLSVADSTRERVISIAKELGYVSVADRYARQSKSGKNAKTAGDKVIGIAQMYELNELKEDIYYMTMKSSVDSCIFSKSWSTEMLYRDDKGNFVKNNNRKLDGIIAIGRFNDKEIKDFNKYTSNIVFIDSSPDDMRYHSIVPNYHMAVRIALTSFVEAGFTDIAYVGAVETYDSSKKMAIDPRYYYYRNSLEIRERFNDSLVIDTGSNNTEAGYRAMKEYLDNYSKPPEAMFISSDAIAPGVVKAILEHGFLIPEDVSIITYNNTAFSSACNPPLDSIEVYIMEYAEAAVQNMIRTWNKEKLPQKVIIPCSLVKRGSIRRSV